MTPNLDKLLASKTGLDPAVVKARQKEQVFRAQKARDYTAQAIRQLHPHDWNALYAQARTKVDAERGPLPGDPT